ncbi:DUF982 domain-containing protein [Chelativorans sp.]|uniref:DUF982 domain-containing protein n=1 Tax=Chelativorans sp. TaxID=2203393 RepID=UPI0028124F38|nr:DUF982 domain-containing protein [Chelativorans sp.]
MAIPAWKEPVTVFAGRHGATRWLVGDPAKALEVLTRHWPKHAVPGPAHRAACNACLDAVMGRGDADAAREAFVRAAEEADILAP